MGEPDLSLKARRLLRIMNRMDRDVTTKDLTRESELKNYTVGDHMGSLIEEGFADHVGWQDVGAPQKAKVYSITEAGQEHAEKVLGELQQEAEVEGVDGSLVRELREKVARLEERDDKRLDQIEELQEQVEKHEVMYEHFKKR